MLGFYPGKDRCAPWTLAARSARCPGELPAAEVATHAIRTIQLIGTGIETSRLGFGTSSLMGRLGKRESLRLLEEAYAHGIRYFDTAPAYGYGEAEVLLGRFSRVRKDIAIATKFGLARPAAASFLHRAARNVARPLLAQVPALRQRASRAVGSCLAPISRFDVLSARKSLHDSLRFLRRDFIDVLLLHDCRVADLGDESLLSFLEQARTRGDVRSFGIATDVATIAHAIDAAPRYAQVVQLANNMRERNLQNMPLFWQQRACITHSPFGGWGKVVSARSEQLLRYALSENTNGVVLFGTQSSGRIADNARILASFEQHNDS